MLSPSHLHFRVMSPEAQQAALQRLAWRGCNLATISAQTGMPESSIRRLLDLQPLASPANAVISSAARAGAKRRLGFMDS
jgi:hypothetical protein